MTNNYQISIIVPVYNVENYLSVCIESILAQSFTDFELLIINDGSNDSSGAICDYYATLDIRVKVLHKKNGGVGAARNDGIRMAKGKWILFIDSDDWIGNDYVLSFMSLSKYTDKETLIIQSMQEYSLDIVEGFYDFQNSEGLIRDLFLKYDLHIFGSPVCKLYNKEVILNNSLMFSEIYSYGEDTIFYLNYLLHIKKMRVLSNKDYFYRRHSSETLSKKAHPIDEQMVYLITHLELIHELILSKGLCQKKVYNIFSEFYTWGLFMAWKSQYRMGYTSDLIKSNAFKYSDTIKHILSTVKPSSIKSFLAFILLKNIKVLSTVSYIDKRLRK